MYKYAFMALGGIGILISLWGIVKWHAKTHFDRGVAFEVAAQAERDALIASVGDDLKTEIDVAEDVRNETTKEIRTEIRTGISEIHLTRATENARQSGRELGRAETIATYKANPSACLNVMFSPNDQLLNDGQNQQYDIFGYVVGSDTTNETNKVSTTGRPTSISFTTGSIPKVTD